MGRFSSSIILNKNTSALTKLMSLLLISGFFVVITKFHVLTFSFPGKRPEVGFWKSNHYVIHVSHMQTSHLLKTFHHCLRPILYVIDVWNCRCISECTVSQLHSLTYIFTHTRDISHASYGLDILQITWILTSSQSDKECIFLLFSLPLW